METPCGFEPRPGHTVELELCAQFVLLVGVNALVGGMIGQERTVRPLLATGEFGLDKYTGTLMFIAAFGIIRSRYQLRRHAVRPVRRKPVLVAGWLIVIPIPLPLMWAPTWGWVVFANVLLGVNQGLTWSTTVIMKIDLVGPARRGFTMGLNGAAGYGAVAVTALATGWIAAEHGLRPEPLYLGLAYAALGLSTRAVAALTAASGVIALVHMHETLPVSPAWAAVPASASGSRSRTSGGRY